MSSKCSIRSAMEDSHARFGIRCYKILFEVIRRTKIEFIMENVAEFSEMPLFNNLKIANLCNKGLCPEKVESIINDLLLRVIFFQCTGNWKGYIHTFLP